MKVRPRRPTTRSFAPTLYREIKLPSVPDGEVFQRHFLLLKSSVRCYASFRQVQHGRAFQFRATTVVRLNFRYDQLHYGSSTLLDAESINYVDRANQPPVSDGVRPQFLPSNAGNAGRWMTQPKAWKPLSRKVHKHRSIRRICKLKSTKLWNRIPEQPNKLRGIPLRPT